jgi:hypothetical protein
VTTFLNLPARNEERLRYLFWNSFTVEELQALLRIPNLNLRCVQTNEYDKPLIDNLINKEVYPEVKRTLHDFYQAIKKQAMSI